MDNNKAGVIFKESRILFYRCFMNKELFNVAIKEESAEDYTGRYRVLKVISHTENEFFEEDIDTYVFCHLLVVCPDKTLRLVSCKDCLFLGF